MLRGRAEHTIGRGEVAEGRVEAPFFALFMLLCAAAILVVHLCIGNNSITLALAVSILVFGTTVIRVEFGVYILAAAMLLSPEVSAGPMGPGRQQFLNIRYDDLLIIVIFLGVLVKHAFEGRRMFWRPSPINKGIVAYVAICLVSTIRALMLAIPSWDKKMAFFVLLKMAEFYMVFFLVGNAIRTLPEVRRQVRVFLAVGLIVSVHCILQIGSAERLSAPFEQGGTEPNTLGGYLILVICMNVALLTQAPSRRAKTLYAAMTIAAFIPFLYALSRASYIAFLAAMIALGVFGRRVWVVLAVIVICCLFPLMPTDVRDRVNATFQRGSGEEIVLAGHKTGVQVDKSTYERIYVWDKVKHNLRFHPVLGLGVAWGMVLDSQYARVIMETGLLGLAAFLFVQYQIIRCCRQAQKWSGLWLGRAIGLGVAGASVGLIVHSLGTITFLIVRIMEPYWLLVALAVVVRDVSRSRQRSDTAEPRECLQCAQSLNPSPTKAQPQDAPA